MINELINKISRFQLCDTGVRMMYCEIKMSSVILQVRAAYKYVAEDDDELSFEKGEIISVIEFEDPEEQVILLLKVS